MTDAMAAPHKSPLCSSEIRDCLQGMAYQRHSGITHGAANACHQGDSQWSKTQTEEKRKVIIDVQISV